MFCNKCGNQLPDDAIFCSNCGTKVSQVVSRSLETVKIKEVVDLDKIDNIAETKLDQVEAQVVSTVKEAEQREQLELQGIGGNLEANKDHGGQISESLADTLLKAIAVLAIVTFGFFTIRQIIYLLGTVFSQFGFMRRYGLIRMFLGLLFPLITSIVSIVAYLLFAVSSFTIGFKRKDSQTTELLIVNACSTILLLLAFVITALTSRFRINFIAFLPFLLGLIYFVGFFVVLYLSGRKTLLAMDYSNLKNVLSDAFNAFLEALSVNKDTKDTSALVMGTVNQVNTPGTINSTSVSGNVTTAVITSPNATMGTATPTLIRPIVTNRGIFKYIIFTILTCGIYSLFFVHGVARDVNEMCKEDGKKVGGLLAYFLLSIVTCGIYSIYWQYKIADRLHANAPRYGLMFSESGSSILLWDLIGILLCGIGPFIAMNIIIRNTNRLAERYNAMGTPINVGTPIRQ